MPRKCCVYGCYSNYDSQKESVKMFTFPSDVEEMNSWKQALPNVIKVFRHELKLKAITFNAVLFQEVTPHMGICVKHWPPNAPMVKKRRFERPQNPPSIFPGIPQSCCFQTAPS